ncbi:MAG: hypothetical protein ABIF89_01675, partial [bacterium]
QQAYPTVDIKANGFDGPITIPYNASATLTWSSLDATSCTASGGWSGAKATSGSQTTGNITSGNTYVITCTSSLGTASDSVFISPESDSRIAVLENVRNYSDGGSFAKTASADPLEKLEYSVQVSALTALVQDISLRVTLPAGIKYEANLKVNGIAVNGDIIAGINIGNIVPGQPAVITFSAAVDEPGVFNYGTSSLVSTVLGYTINDAVSDAVTVYVTRRSVAGEATEIPTGITDLALDYVLIPLGIAAGTVALFKKYLLIIDQWLEKKKKSLSDWKAEKDYKRITRSLRTRERYGK